MIEKILIKIKSTCGTSMAELIVSFALLSLFMAMATMLLSNYIEVFTKTNGMALGRSVSDTIMDTIDGNLSKATPNTLKSSGENFTYIILTKGENDKIKFSNKDGYETEIFVNDKNLLQINYNTKISADVGGSESSEEITEWFYGEDVYMGNEISKLEIERIEANSGSKNFFDVTITLKSKKTGFEYKSKRTIECHNLTYSTGEYVKTEYE